MMRGPLASYYTNFGFMNLPNAGSQVVLVTFKRQLLLKNYEDMRLQ